LPRPAAKLRTIFTYSGMLAAFRCPNRNQEYLPC
jgi:hypothetical protein